MTKGMTAAQEQGLHGGSSASGSGTASILGNRSHDHGGCSRPGAGLGGKAPEGEDREGLGVLRVLAGAFECDAA